MARGLRWTEEELARVVAQQHAGFVATHGDPARRPHKYHAESVVVDGIRFDSKREAAHWRVLQLRQRGGEIEKLARQVRFALNVTAPSGASVRVADIVLDFVYVEGGRLVVADAKGVRTQAYVLKKKMFEAQSGLQIQEV
jgi:hypothetical protein